MIYIVYDIGGSASAKTCIDNVKPSEEAGDLWKTCPGSRDDAKKGRGNGRGVS